MLLSILPLFLLIPSDLCVALPVITNPSTFELTSSAVMDYLNASDALIWTTDISSTTGSPFIMTTIDPETWHAASLAVASTSSDPSPDPHTASWLPIPDSDDTFYERTWCQLRHRATPVPTGDAMLFIGEVQADIRANPGMHTTFYAFPHPTNEALFLSYRVSVYYEWEELYDVGIENLYQDLMLKDHECGGDEYGGFRGGMQSLLVSNDRDKGDRYVAQVEVYGNRYG